MVNIIIRRDIEGEFEVLSIINDNDFIEDVEWPLSKEFKSILIKELRAHLSLSDGVEGFDAAVIEALDMLQVPR